MRKSLRGINVWTIVVSVAFSTGFGSISRADDVASFSNFIRSKNIKSQVVKPPKGLLKHTYFVPSGPYTELFDWDSYFMGVALSYDGVSLPLAGSTEDFLDFIGEKEPYKGYVPREVAPDGLWAIPQLPGGLGSWEAKLALKIAMALKDYQWISHFLDCIMIALRDLTPPFLRSLPEQCKPVLAQMVVRASETMNNYAWLTPTYYAELKTSLTYWETARRAKDGLFLWHNGLESGVDNSYVVSSQPPQITEGVDLQVYMYREYQAMAVVAQHIGQTADVAVYNQKAQALRDLVLERMWSEQDGFFYNIDSRNGQQIRAATWTGFTVLWAKIATPAQGSRMISEHLLNRAEFWAPNGIRTVPASSRLYDPKSGYWRGPVWVISNYIAMHAMMNYGYQSEALELAHATVDLLNRDFAKSGGMNEAYNPETGAPVANPNFVSWNLLAEHMVEEATTGSDPTRIQ